MPGAAGVWRRQIGLAAQTLYTFQMADGMSPRSFAGRDVAGNVFVLPRVLCDGCEHVIRSEVALLGCLSAGQALPGYGDLRDEHLLDGIGGIVDATEIVA